MNKTSTYVGIIGIILLVASLIYTYKYAPIKPGADYGNSQNATSTASTDDDINDTNVRGISDASLAAYIDPSEVFTFEYPKELTVQVGSVSNTNAWREFSTQGELGRVRATINISRSFEPNTNFSDAKFKVSLGANTIATQKCLTVPNQNQNNPVSEKVTIHGLTFTKFKFGDAAMGNYYNTVSYHAIHEGQCIVLEYTIHSTNLDSYDPNQGVKAFNEARIINIFEDIIQSFKLLDVVQDDAAQNIDKGISRQVTVDGTFTCLSHKNTSGPQTMECAYGIAETKTGLQYALDISMLDQSDQTLVSGGGNIRISGLMLPIEAVSSNQWQKYSINGIIRAEKVTKL